MHIAYCYIYLQKHAGRIFLRTKEHFLNCLQMKWHPAKSLFCEGGFYTFFLVTTKTSNSDINGCSILREELKRAAFKWHAKKKITNTQLYHDLQ